MRLASGLVALALGGCNSILGIGDIHPGAAVDAPVAIVDAPPNTVIGSSVVTYVKSDGTTATHDEDLTGYTIRAFVPDASATGFRIAPGTGTADGTFSVPDVPDGIAYTLELTPPNAARPSLYVTKQHVVDVGFNTLGRPDGVSVSRPTPVTMTIAGMTAWGPDDWMLIDSFATGTENLLQQNKTVTNAPTVGATALTGLGVDWQSGYTYDFNGAPPRLVQHSAGDDFALVHVHPASSHDDAGHAATFETIVDLFTSATVDMSDGAATQVTGTFTATPANTFKQTLHFDLPQLRALAGDGNHYSDESVSCSRLSNYAISYDGRIGAGTWSVSESLQAWITQTSVTDRPYGDPFPAAWATMMSCSYLHFRYFRLAAINKVFQTASNLTQDQPATDNQLYTPVVGAAADIKIGAAAFLDGGNLPFDGTAPVTLSWSPVANAGRYRVIARHYFANGVKVANAQVIGISTADTTVTIPASFFQKGEFYAFQLFADSLSVKTAYTDGRLRAFTFPGGAAVVSSGQFRLSSDCGNHTTDAGEQCDDGAESATCDVDCTKPVCGDGLTNKTAGEACDDGLDSVGCDSDCTAVVCGDGHVNPYVEECDDGNQVNGDGCSATCRFEGCGNGMVNATYEGCDDGGRISGDGCDAECQIEGGYTCTGAPSVCTPA